MHEHLTRTSPLAALLLFLFSMPVLAGEGTLAGEAMYKHLVKLAASSGEESQLFQQLGEASKSLTFEGVEQTTFDGHLRMLEIPSETEGEKVAFYFIRAVDGEIFILAMDDPTASYPDDEDHYQGLAKVVGKKTRFVVLKSKATVGGTEYGFVKLEAKPEQLLLDRLFFAAIVLLLFLTMVGMGMTLTVDDFAQVFKTPLAMIVGPICIFGIMPLIAVGMGHAFGFYDAFPFIFLGMILIAVTPGGVTSNLMTYFGKGDVALSVSLTAVCTVAALFFTPVLLQVFGPNIPDFSIPVMAVFKTMLVLVVVPLFVGMLVRWKAEGFARKAEKVFAIIGLFALLFLIVVGIWSNLEKFADTDRYGIKFYAMVFLLTFAGMIVSSVISKLLRVKNYQIRAISLETGLRNASLAMTIALLLQDQMGDFYSSMFFTSGIFGLWMYVAGAISIYLYPKLFPLTDQELADHKSTSEAS
jgi:predicted Na+-dependent transporter